MHSKINQKYFEGQSFFVGIDFHNKNWKVTILSQNHEHKSMSHDPDPEILANYLHRNFPGGTFYAAYEAGFCGFYPARKLQQLGIDCRVVNPADVPTGQKEKLQKTDLVDSRKIARTLRNNEFEFIEIPDEQLEADRTLVRQRYSIIKDITRVKNRVRALLKQFDVTIPEHITYYQVRHWSKSYINWLKGLTFQNKSIELTLKYWIKDLEAKREIYKEVNQEVRKLACSSRYDENRRLLMGIPGIGLIGAITLLTEIGDINRFNTLDQLSAFVGLVPAMHGSGDKFRTGTLVHRGRKSLKNTIIEASWTAARKDPALLAKFEELTSTMKKNKAIIRIARKLLNRLRHVLKNQTEYELGVIE